MLTAYHIGLRISEVFRYIDEIVKATEDIVNNDVEYIELPDELEEIKNRMNHLKRESEKNEKLLKIQDTL
jgi:chromosome segregation ATPase